MKNFRKNIALATATAFSLLSQQAFAGNAASVRDLLGAKGSSGEAQLESRGFTFITSRPSGSSMMNSYWWHGGDKHCIAVETYDGRYSTINDATPGDCHQKSNAGGAVAAVAGIAILGALLAHKSDHHETGQHYAAPTDEAQYERGFNDGLHGQTYHNYDRADAYSRGYEAGVRQNSHNTAYRGNGYQSGGYAQVVKFNDLQGARASSADGEMGTRGFSNVDGFKMGTTAYTIWYNRNSRQCVQMTVAEGRVDDIRDIGNHPKCR